MDVFAANDLAPFVAVTGTPTEITTAGRFDAAYTTKAIQIPTGVKAAGCPFIDPTTGLTINLTDGWFHCEIWNDWYTSGSVLIEFLNSAGTVVFRLCSGTTGHNHRIQHWNGSAFVDGPLATVESGDQQKHSYDFHFACGLDGTIDFIADQVFRHTVTGLFAACNNVQSIRIAHNGSGAGLAYSQILVSTESTVGAKVASLIPNANGANTAWANDYTSVVKLGINDAGLITSSVTGDKESYAASNATLPLNYAISSVWFNVRAKLGSIAPVNFKPLIRLGSTDYPGAYNFANLSAVAFSGGVAAFPVDPSTGLPWDITNVNLAELGFVSAA